MIEIKTYIEKKFSEISTYINQNNLKLKLVIINIGDDLASQTYIRGKLKDAAKVNIEAEVIHYDENIDENIVYSKIIELNNDDSVTGFIIQLPLPKKFNENKLIEAIDPKKDVDGFSKLALVNPGTPQGVIDFLDFNNIDYTDKNAVVIGRSNIVGKPMARLFLEKNCNVVQLHSKTSEENKRNFIKDADIIVVAAGHRNIIDSSYDLKPSCIIMDIGMNINDKGKLCGDVEQDLPVYFKSPTPGGSGLLTRLALITNLIKLYKLQF